MNWSCIPVTVFKCYICYWFSFAFRHICPFIASSAVRCAFHVHTILTCNFLFFSLCVFNFQFFLNYFIFPFNILHELVTVLQKLHLCSKRRFLLSVIHCPSFKTTAHYCVKYSFLCLNEWMDRVILILAHRNPRIAVELRTNFQTQQR